MDVARMRIVIVVIVIIIIIMVVVAKAVVFVVTKDGRDGRTDGWMDRWMDRWIDDGEPAGLCDFFMGHLGIGRGWKVLFCDGKSRRSVPLAAQSSVSVTIFNTQKKFKMTPSF
jgi:hypothetical protein